MTPAQLAHNLSDLLTEFGRVYARLDANVAAHREAIRLADGQAMARAVHTHEQLTHAAAMCDQKRRELVLACVRSFPTLANTPAEKVTLSDLARCAAPQRQGELLHAAGGLRELVSRVAAESASLKSATLTLLAHMEGLLRQVGRTLSHSGVYSRRGVVEPGGAVVSALDLRS